jgi:pectate lyase
MRLSDLIGILSISAPLAGAFPLGSFGLASWDVEGFAKDNPLGPTTGGKGGATVTVNNPADFQAAVAGNEPKIIYVKGELNLTARAKIGSNKSVIGVGSTAHITGRGLDVVDATNVIIRNMKVSFIEDNDCITIRNSTRVWVDHNEFTSDITKGPDFFVSDTAYTSVSLSKLINNNQDGQVDIIRGSDWITVSWNYFHDHWKSSLVGNDPTFRDIDGGHLHVTYHHNYWRNEGTRGPAGRFGHQHIYNNLYVDFLYQAIHSRSDNQVLVEGNVFRGKTREALSSYGLVIPEDSPNTCTCGDEELDGYANLGASEFKKLYLTPPCLT